MLRREGPVALLILCYTAFLYCILNQWSVLVGHLHQLKVLIAFHRPIVQYNALAYSVNIASAPGSRSDARGTSTPQHFHQFLDAFSVPQTLTIRCNILNTFIFN